MALHVDAQDKVKLSGRVIDDEQNPVLFAVVKVDGQAVGTTTDLQGRYQLEFSTADTVTVSFAPKAVYGSTSPCKPKASTWVK